MTLHDTRNSVYLLAFGFLSFIILYFMPSQGIFFIEQWTPYIRRCWLLTIVWECVCVFCSFLSKGEGNIKWGRYLMTVDVWPYHFDKTHILILCFLGVLFLFNILRSPIIRWVSELCRFIDQIVVFWIKWWQHILFNRFSIFISLVFNWNFKYY